MTDSEVPTRILTLDNLDLFDEVSEDDVESVRKALSLTPLEMAAALNWSSRKYSRVLEAARESGTVDRDFALALRGLLHVCHDHRQSAAPTQDDGSFLDGKSFEGIFQHLQQSAGGWSSEVAPHLLRLLAERAANKSAISYGEAATVLEDRKMTHKVWPRTAYGRPLGLICEALHELEKQTGKRIPPISVIVTKAGGDPSEGIDWHVKKYLKLHGESTKKLKEDRSTLMQNLHEEVFEYPNWPGVVRALLGRQS